MYEDIHETFPNNFYRRESDRKFTEMTDLSNSYYIQTV